MRLAARTMLLAAAGLAAAGVLTSEDRALNAAGLETEVERPKVTPEMVEFVEKYCAECHNDFQMEGDRSFDPFLSDPDNPTYHHTVVEMLDEINRGTMPKVKAGVLQPSDDERREIVASFTGYLVALADLEAPAETPLRRLTNAEYRNTVRDLLGVNPEASEAAMQFTADANVHGLENLAVAQSLSRQQLQDYILAAQQYLDAAFAPLHTETVDPTRLIIQPRELMRYRGATEVTRQTWVTLSEDRTSIDVGYGRVEGLRPMMPRAYINQGGVPADGVYVIRVEAEAVNRLDPFNREYVRHNAAAEPLKLAIGYAPSPEKIEVVHAPERPVIETFDVADDKRQVYEVQVELRKGSVPMFFWPNAPRGGSGTVARAMHKLRPDMSYLTHDDRPEAFTGFNGRTGVPGNLDRFIREDFKGARLRVYGMEIIGPFPNEVPGAFSKDDYQRFVATPRGQLGGVFREFASKAFRRPVAQDEIANYLALANREMDKGASKEEAIKLGFAAIMASPRFLYLDEGNAEDERRITTYELASRLSYFLWNSMPDDRLLELADNGQLMQPAVLRDQVRRMINDPKASNFVAGFTNAWLRLDKLGTMPPDQRVHGAYFARRLEGAMRKETELVFSEILLLNRPTRQFLDSDFTYVNGGLANLYNIRGVNSENFARVDLPEGHARRGLIGHASILTASANGIDTSPVVRGVWVLENLLGTPPPPPPPDVPAIEPDQRGATTVRELLAKHREVQACADCHVNIDPYGFPLEVFGPIGEMRQRYPAQVDGRVRLNRGPEIDASATMPAGDPVNNLNQFRTHLLTRERNFETHLVEKLMAYGTGRETTFRDNAEVARILDELEQEDGGFQDMVVKVLTSDHFLSR